MAEYIDKDALDKSFLMLGYDKNDLPRRMLRVTPMVDVVPVVHAKWAWITDDDVMCTACGGINNTDDNADAGLSIWKFCPKCGAKMDKE